MGWDNDNWGYMDRMHNGSGAWGAGMGILFLVFIGLAIWLVVRLARHNKVATPLISAPHKETPKDILDRRFANGEITADEYKTAKDLLGS